MSKSVIIRLIIELAGTKGRTINQVNVNKDFLHATLNEELYLTHPPGYKADVGQVYKLRKSLYGLKKVLRVWFSTLCKGKKMQFIGFQ